MDNVLMVNIMEVNVLNTNNFPTIPRKGDNKRTIIQRAMARKFLFLHQPYYIIRNVSAIPLFIYSLFSLALQPSAGYGLLVHEVS
jgi:hypothetical protein